MFDPKAIGTAFGKAAAGYDQHATLQADIRARTLSLAEKYFPQEGTILDLGAGTGAFTSEAKSYCWDITSLDIAYGMCQQACAHSRQIVNGAAEQLPFKDSAFGGVFSSLMAQWASDNARLFAEINRVLQKDAHVVMATFSQGTLQELKEAFSVVDNHPHVSDFQGLATLDSAMRKQGIIPVYKQEHTYREYKPDLNSVMADIRMIGAGNKKTDRKRGLMTPAQLQKLEDAYEQQRQKQGLPVSWQVVYLVGRKR